MSTLVNSSRSNRNNDCGNSNGVASSVAIFADFRLALHPVLAATNNRQRFPSCVVQVIGGKEVDECHIISRH
ncbi:hypothetical protein ACLKA6_004913 [Drosophila palustris]